MVIRVAPCGDAWVIRNRARKGPKTQIAGPTRTDTQTSGGHHHLSNGTVPPSQPSQLKPTTGFHACANMTCQRPHRTWIAPSHPSHLYITVRHELGHDRREAAVDDGILQRKGGGMAV